MRLYQVLGWLNLALIVIVTAPYWLRTLNQWTVKTRDKRFLNCLKFLRRLHKPIGIAIAALALWHGFIAWGSLRPHTGMLVYASFILTALLGAAHWRRKDKRAFKGHKVMALLSVLLMLLHLLWPSALYSLFGV